MNERGDGQWIKDTELDMGPRFSHENLTPPEPEIDKLEELEPTARMPKVDAGYPPTERVELNHTPERPIPPTEEVDLLYIPTEKNLPAVEAKRIPPTEKVVLADNKKTDPEIVSLPPEVEEDVREWMKEVRYRTYPNAREQYREFDNAFVLIGKVETLERRLRHIQKALSNISKYEEAYGEIDEEELKRERKYIEGDPEAKEEENKKGALKHSYETLDSIIDDAREQGLLRFKKSRKIHKKVSKLMKKGDNWKSKTLMAIRDGAIDAHEHAGLALDQFKKYLGSRNERKQAA